MAESKKPMSFDEWASAGGGAVKPVETGLAGRAGDLGLSMLKGAVAVPEAAVGVADLVTGGKAGKKAEELGFRPKEAKGFLDSLKSDAAKDAQYKFENAEGFTGKFGAAVQNPSLIANAIAESVPLIGAGGVVGRGLLAAAPRISGAGAAAIGEGAVGAGSAAEGIRQETPGGELTGTQSLLAAGSGAATGLLGLGGAKAAKALGVGDIDQAIVGGTTKVAGQAGKPAPGMLSSVGRGALSEGVFEELPQSLSEQAIQNVALDKPWTQDLDSAAAMGLLTGGAMGGGMGLMSRQDTPAQAQPAAAPSAPVQPAVTDQLGQSLTGTPMSSLMAGGGLTGAANPLGKMDDLTASTAKGYPGMNATGQDVTVDPETGAIIPAEPGIKRWVDPGQQSSQLGSSLTGASMASMMGGSNGMTGAPAADDWEQSLAETNALIAQSNSQAADDWDQTLAETNALIAQAAPPKPSEQMGLNPNAGPLSAAAVTAVDGGATPSMQAAAQATAQQEQDTQAQQQADSKLKSSGWTMNEYPVGDEPMVASLDSKDQPLFMTQAGETFNVRDADWNVIATGNSFEEAAGRAKVHQASGGKAVQPTTGATDGVTPAQTQQTGQEGQAESETDWSMGAKPLATPPGAGFQDSTAKRAQGLKAIRERNGLNKPVALIDEGKTAPKSRDEYVAEVRRQLGDIKEGDALTNDAGDVWTVDVIFRDKNGDITAIIPKERGNGAEGASLDIDGIGSILMPSPYTDANGERKMSGPGTVTRMATAQDQGATAKTDSAEQPGKTGEGAGVSQPKPLTTDARKRNLATLKQRMMAGRKQPDAQASPVPAGVQAPDVGSTAMDAAQQGATEGQTGTGAADGAAQESAAPSDDLNAMFDDVLAEEVAKDEAAKRPDNGTHYAAGMAAFKEGKSRDLPSYFTKPGDKNSKDWFRGWDAANSAKPTNLKQAITQQRAKRAPRTATQAATSAAKNTASALGNAIDGLGALFGGNGKLSSGLTFDEQTYAKAKPLFQAAVANLGDAGRDMKEAMRAVVRMVMDKFGAQAAQNMKPYVVRFIEDTSQENLDTTTGQTDTGTKEPQNDRPTGNQPDTGSTGVQGEQPGELQQDAGAVRRGNAKSNSRNASRGTNENAPPDFVPAAGGLTREGSWFETAKRNIDLIELAIQIESEKRPATPEEQAKLSKYVGFGASAIRNELFPVPPAWAKAQEPSRLIWPQYVRSDRFKPLAERIEALPREWQQSILQSSQYAHYTSEGIIRSVWGALQRMGFNGGQVFEPGMGIGSFSMLMPDAIRAESRYTGVEFDAPTALIAKLLSPQQNMLHGDFIKGKYPKNFFDVNVGNPPFSQTKIFGDPEYAKKGFMLHDFFFAKGIDLVRPGGIQVFVTSKGTMDKQTDKARKYLSERADLLGAIRLPSTAFEDNAGTSVVTDVIFLRKRLPGEAPAGESWANVSTVETPDGPVVVNEYFARHPEMVLGQQRISGNVDDQGRRINSNGMGGEKYTVVSYDETPAELEAKFAKAIENLPQGIYAEKQAKADKAKDARVDFDPSVKREGVVYLAKDGTLMRVAEGVGVPLANTTKLSEKDQAWFKSYVGLRDLVQAARFAQLEDGKWELALAKLNKAYDQFVKDHGHVLDYRVMTRKSTDEEGNVVETETRIPKNRRLLREDYDQALVTSLEAISEDGSIVKSPFLKGRTIGKPVSREVKSIGDALAVSMDETGHLDLADIGERLKLDEAETIEALGSQIYQTPDGVWQLADEYLSGDVVAKLEEAEAAARINPDLKRNVEALKEAQPEKLGPAQISAKLGASWIPESHVNAFATEIDAGQVTFDPRTETWQVKGGNERSSRKAGAEYGTAKRSPSELLEAVLNSRSIKLFDKIDGKKVPDQEGTTAANEIAKKIKEKFKGWVWTDSDRATELVESYNKNFNNIAPRKFDGSHLTLPGVSLRYKLHPHQLRAIWRMVQTGNTYLAHAVGAGKTIEMIAGGMEQKRLGLIKKPMYVVPNHMLEQFSNEFMELYPQANIMVADDENFSPERRKAFIASSSMNSPDAIIITIDAFKMIGVKEESVAPIRDEILADLEIELSETAKGNDTRVRRGQLEQQIEAVKQRFDRIIAAGAKDSTIKFEDMGVDFIFADEAHTYRKLDFHTAQSIKGIDPVGSKAAMGMYVKTRILDKRKPGRSMVFASGTPVTNTMGELYTVMRFFAGAELGRAGISTFDAWARQFGEVAPALEPNAAGKYELIERFAKFDNVPELMSRVRQFMDVLTSDNLGALVKRPKIIGGKPNLNIIPTNSDLTDYMKGELARRIEVSRAWKPSKDQPYNPDPIVSIITDGRFAAIDPRFFGSTLKDGVKSIITEMGDKVAASYHATKNDVYLDKDGKEEKIKGSTQIVFYNLGFGDQSKKNRGFNARAAFTKRLTDGGIPRDEIAWFDDATTDAKKEAVFKAMRNGTVKVLIGSAKKMGTGVNVQKRLAVLHYQDPPWFPADVEQPHGRILRQGNQNEEIAIEWYTTKGTYQSTMWQMVGRKQRFIDQAFTGDKTLRSMDDLGEASLFEQAAAVASGDPRAIQLAGLKQDVERFTRLQAAHASEQVNARSTLSSILWQIESGKKYIKTLEKSFKAIGEKYFLFTSGRVDGRDYQKQGEFGQAVKDEFNKVAANSVMGELVRDQKIASLGDAISVVMDSYISSKGEKDGSFDVHVVFGGSSYPLANASAMGADVDATGLARRIFNKINEVESDLQRSRRSLEANETDAIKLRKKLGAPFEYQQEMAEKYGELKRLEAELEAEGKATPAPPALVIKADGTTNGETSTDAGQPSNPDDEAPAASRARPVFSRAAQGQASGVVQGIVDAITARWANAPKVVVAFDMNDPAIPERVRQEDQKQRSGGATGTPEGFYYKGTVYLMSSKLAKPGDVVRVLFHESLGHFGLRGVFGKELKPLLQQIATMRKSQIEAKMKEYGLRGVSNVDRLVAAEEVLAEMAQTSPQIGFVRRAIATIKAWLRNHIPGFGKMVMTDDEIISNFIIPARNYVVNGGSDGGPGGGVRFSRKTDIQAARKALEKIMRNGVTSPDDLQALLRVPGYSKWAKSTIAGDVAATTALRGELQQAFPGSNWKAPKLIDQGIITIYPDWDGLTSQNLDKLTRIADKYDAPIGVRGGAATKQLVNRLDGFGFELYSGLQERADRMPNVMFGMIRPAGGITATTPLFSQSQQSPGTLASTIRAAITKAYGNLLTRLEGKGLVTLTQTEEEAIAAAAQARADQNGGDVESIKESLRKSVLASVAPQTESSNFKRWFGDSKVVDADGRPLVVYHGNAGDFSEFDLNRSGETTGNTGFYGAGAYFSEDAGYASGFAMWAQRSEDDAPNVMPVYLALKNPAYIVITPQSKSADSSMLERSRATTDSVLRYLAKRGTPYGVTSKLAELAEANKFEPFMGTLYNAFGGGRGVTEILKGAGFDGVTVYGGIDGKMQLAEAVAFNPTQIKSATGNNGNFDPANPDIRRSADGNLEGFFDPATGKSFLIADNLTAESAPATLMHEVGIHMAAEGKFGPMFDRALTVLNDGSLESTEALRRMQESGETSGEEAAAYLVTVYETNRTNAPASVKQWMKDMIAAVRAWLFTKGVLLKADQLTVADIAAVARANASRMARGDGRTGDGAVRNSKQPTPDKREQTETPEFKRWFAGSQVVDADGKPLVVYHGTGADITEFSMDAAANERAAKVTGVPGFYFSPSPDVAGDYAFGKDGANVMPSYLALRNPKEVVYAELIGGTFDRASLEAQGHDGLTVNRGGKTWAFVAFNPTQIKSAIGNNGDFDGGNSDIRFSRTMGEALTSGVNNVKAFDVTGATSDQLAHYRGMGMQALGRRQIVDLYGDMLPELKAYDSLVQKMDADKNESGAEADALVSDWAKLDEHSALGFGAAKNPGMERKLAELMHDATLAQIDPDKPIQKGDDSAQHAVLAGRFNALSPKAQEVYRTARDMYADHFKKVQEALQERIQRSGMDETSKAKMIAKMDADLFNKLKGVYFPLARFGKYVVVSKNAAGETVSVSRAETLAEANKMRREVVKNSPQGVTVSRVYKDAEFNASRDAVGKGFVSDLMTMLQGQGVGEDVLDSVGQLYLSSLPDLSWAKHGIHRKGTPGFSQDARRAFAQNMFHGARHLAKLRYSDQLADKLMDMEERVKDQRDDEGFDQIKAQQVVDEMNARHETLMNPKTSSLSTALTSVGFVWFLGISPASAMVNLSQTALVAYPVMAAKWGFQKAGAALLSASAEVVRAGNDLSKVLKGDELAAFQKAVDDGTIDVTQAHDLAGVAQGEDERVAMAMRPVMRAASFMFHHAEKFNRQATFIAAYRLAKENGVDADKAFEQAKKATYDAHFDYSAGNRPRIMQGNWQKVLFLFKQYGQNMVYTLARQAYLSMKGMTPEQRTEARKQLGGLLAMHAMAAGALGLPLVGVLLSAASMAGGDDDEPWDAEVALKNMMADAMGPKAAEVMAHGLSRLTPWDLSGRVALNKLILPDIQEGLEGQPLWEKMVTAAAGPVAGIGGGFVKGMAEMGQGQYQRGLESMLPVALKNPVKALRFGEEGAVDKTGVVIKDEVGAAGVIGQAMGFRPSDVALATEGKTAIYQADKALTERRSNLVRLYAISRMNDDSEGTQDALDQVRQFNEKNPNRRITMPNLMQSVRNRQRRIDDAEQGVYLPKNRRDALEAGRFALAD